MRLFRSDLIPVLAIIGGGDVGVLASASQVLRSSPEDVPAPAVVVAPSVTTERAVVGTRGLEKGGDTGRDTVYFTCAASADRVRCSAGKSGEFILTGARIRIGEGPWLTSLGEAAIYQDGEWVKTDAAVAVRTAR